MPAQTQELQQQSSQDIRQSHSASLLQPSVQSLAVQQLLTLFYQYQVHGVVIRHYHQSTTIIPPTTHPSLLTICTCIPPPLNTTTVNPIVCKKKMFVFQP